MQTFQSNILDTPVDNIDTVQVFDGVNQLLEHDFGLFFWYSTTQLDVF